MPNVERFAVKYNPPEKLNCYDGQCKFEANRPQELLKHYTICHARDKEFSSHCLHSTQCFHNNSFKTVGALNSHLRRYHSSFFSKFKVVEQTELLRQQVPDVGTTTAPSVDCCLGPADIELHSSSVDCFAANKERKDLKSIGGHFILSLLSQNKITEASVQWLLPEVQSLVNKSVQYYSDRVQELLEQDSILSAAVAKIEPPALFDSLKSNKLQMNWIEKHFGLIEAVEYQLPEIRGSSANRTGKDQHFHKKTFIYVPIIQQLEQILNITDIYETIFVRETEKNPLGTFSTFRDGDKAKSLEILQLHPKALAIMLYFDEVQLCNPLGSKTQHKLVFVYLTLLNFSSIFRSSLKSIFLVAIYYNKQAKDHDINLILTLIVNDIRKLEEGVSLVIKGLNRRVHGFLFAIIADNLGSHEIGGFKSGFSQNTFRRCRTCLAVDEEIQTQFWEPNLILRTKETHEDHCKRLLSNPSLAGHISTTYGVTFRPIFNDLRYFHSIGGLPPDVMHDLLEGIVPSVVCMFVKSIISPQFKLIELNSIITNFNYGPNEIRDKPSEITKKHLDNNSLRQSSSQIWLLLTLLPVMVVDKIEDVEDYINWRILKLLIQICQIVFSDSCENYDILTLRSLINEFLNGMRELNVTITPKMHNLVHYERYILFLGPMKQFWCMRFEAKHSYFKTLVRTSGNFKNIAKTLSKRHQVWLSDKLANCNGKFLAPNITISKTSICSSLSELSFGNQLQELCDQSTSKTFKTLNWLQVNNLRVYLKKSIILCPTRGAVKLKFGKVIGIFIQADDKDCIYIACQTLKTICYCERYQAYQVKYDGIHHAVYKLKSLTLLKTFALHNHPTSNGEYLIVTKENFKRTLIPSHQSDSH